MSVPEPPRPPAAPAPPTQALTPPSPARPKRNWWQRGWGVVLAAVLGVVVGGAIGAAGNGSTKTVTTEGTARTVQSGQAPTHTVTVTHLVVRNHTRIVTAPASAPASESSGEGSSGGGGKSYSGDGIKSIGTVTVSQPSTLRWHASGGVFGVTGATSGYEHTIAIDSKASSGESAVEPGTYHEVGVTGAGEWSFTISPG
jgi:uncharacterized membrane protein YgcG